MRCASLNVMRVCSEEQRAPYLETIGLAMKRDDDADVRFFSSVSRSMPTASAEDLRRSEGTQRRASPETFPIATLRFRSSPLSGRRRACPEMLLKIDRLQVRRAALGVMEACSAEERAPYLGSIVVMLRDSDGDLRRAALGVVRACSVGEREPHMSTVGAMLRDKKGEMRRLTLGVMEDLFFNDSSGHARRRNAEGAGIEIGGVAIGKISGDDTSLGNLPDRPRRRSAFRRRACPPRY